MKGEHLDLSTNDGLPEETASGGRSSRRFIGVRFDCCDVYVRVYVNRAGTAYQGHCPKCSKPIRIRIGPGGTDSRFFRVS